jgi:hypothetical protein
LEQLADVQQLSEFVACSLERRRFDAIDLLMQPEGLLGRQIPPQLVLLPHDQCEAPAERIFAFPRHITHDSRVATRRVDTHGSHITMFAAN